MYGHRDPEMIRLVRRLDLEEHRMSELWGRLAGHRSMWEGEVVALERMAAWVEAHDEIHESHPLPGLREVLAPYLDPQELAARSPDGLQRTRLAIHQMMGHVRDAARSRERQPEVVYDRIRPVEMVLKDSHLVFTGVLASCEREVAEMASAYVGANVRQNVALCGNWLVVGTRCHPGWKHSRRGRKIEKVEQWRAEGRTQCRIVPERIWAMALWASPAGRAARKASEEAKGSEEDGTQAG